MEDQEDKGKKTKRIKANFITKHYLGYVMWRLKKTHPNLTHRVVARIISRYQELIREDIEMGIRVKFRRNLGTIETTRIKTETSLDENGNVKTNMPIDRKRTEDLWKEYPHLRDKQYVRFLNAHSKGYLFSMTYKKKDAVFNCKSIYVFYKNRVMRSTFSKNIIDKKVEAFIKPTY